MFLILKCNDYKNENIGYVASKKITGGKNKQRIVHILWNKNKTFKIQQEHLKSIYKQDLKWLNPFTLSVNMKDSKTGVQDTQ